MNKLCIIKKVIGNCRKKEIDYYRYEIGRIESKITILRTRYSEFMERIIFINNIENLMKMNPIQAEVEVIYDLEREPCIANQCSKRYEELYGKLCKVKNLLRDIENKINRVNDTLSQVKKQVELLDSKLCFIHMLKDKNENLVAYICDYQLLMDQVRDRCYLYAINGTPGFKANYLYAGKAYLEFYIQKYNDELWINIVEIENRTDSLRSGMGSMMLEKLEEIISLMNGEYEKNENKRISRIYGMFGPNLAIIGRKECADFYIKNGYTLSGDTIYKEV